MPYSKPANPADEEIVTTYAAEPGSRSDEALKLLGSWAATADAAASVRATDLGS